MLTWKGGGSFETVYPAEGIFLERSVYGQGCQRSRPILCGGEIFSWGKKLHVYDLRGDEVAFIQQRLLTFLPRYEVYTKT